MIVPKEMMLDLCKLVKIDKKETAAIVDEIYQPSLLKNNKTAQDVLDYLKKHGLVTITHPSHVRKAAKRLGITILEFVDAVIMLEDCKVLESTFIKADSHNVSSNKTISQDD